MGFWSARSISRHRPHRSAASSGSSWGATGFKRGQDRVEFEGRVTLVAADRHVHSKSGNLSEGGAFILCDDPPAVGETVRILIRLDNRLSLSTDAVVRWHDFDEDLFPTGCGVEFQGLAEAQKQALRAVLFPAGCEEEDEQDEVAEIAESGRATG